MVSGDRWIAILGSAVWVAHASRVSAKPSRVRGPFQRSFGRDAESPSRTGVTRETRALPGKNPCRSAYSAVLCSKRNAGCQPGVGIRQFVDVQQGDLVT